MPDERFWSLIEQARSNPTGSADPERLQSVLRELESEEIAAFVHAFYERLCDLNQRRLWGAGCVIMPSMSGDSFHYFRSWIIGKGKEACEAALQAPDELAAYLDGGDVDNELLEYAGLYVLEERAITEDPRDRSERTADSEPAGEPFRIESLASDFPKLHRWVHR